jgi:predicted O-methyltransferase YrrM
MDRRIPGTLNFMAKNRRTHLSVPVADGRALRVLLEAAGAKRVVEIGTSTGYSALWICLALRKTGGRLITFEVDPARAAIARGHFKKAGVEGVVRLREGDAHEELGALKGPIDAAFIDAEKTGYLDYLRQLLPKVKAGGLILAHNIDMAPDYVKAVTHSRVLETIFFRDGAGLGVSMKLKA